MSGRDDARMLVRQARREHRALKQNGRAHHLDDCRPAIPAIPAAQRHVRQGHRGLAAVSSGQPVYPMAEYAGPHAAGLVTGGSAGQARRHFIVPADDAEAFRRWGRRKRWACYACAEAAAPGAIFLVNCELTEDRFVRTCTHRLQMARDRAWWLAGIARVSGNLYFLSLCRSCLRRSGLLRGAAEAELMTMADGANPGLRGAKRVLTVREQLQVRLAGAAGMA